MRTLLAVALAICLPQILAEGQQFSAQRQAQQFLDGVDSFGDWNDPRRQIGSISVYTVRSLSLSNSK